MALAGCATNQVEAIAKDGQKYQGVEAGDSLLKYPPVQVSGVPNLHIEGPIFYAPSPEIVANPLTLPIWIDDGYDSTKELTFRSIEGYRIQLFAGRDKLQAKRVEGDALNRSGLSVYLNYEAPQYKVRVGNFSDRDQAMQDCNRLKQLGFSEAWVVRTTIMAQR